MTLYQLVVGRLNGDDIGDPLYREKITDLVKKGLGGFIVFGGKREEVSRFIDELQSLAEITLFIASDIERGVAQQIAGMTPFPCPMAVAAAIDKESPAGMKELEDALGAVAGEAVSVGINLPLIPVMDVNLDPDNPIICTRAFSDDPETVSKFGSLYIKVLERAGLISCAKHFPGHGDTSTDSHIELPVITKSLDDLMAVDIIPFEEGIRAGARSIMVGHVSIPSLDTLPASISKKTITGLLREKLGFDGLVLTDALNMHALRDIDNLAARCIDAGADILLHPEDADATVKDLRSAMEQKIIGRDRIDASLTRILKAKAGFGRIRKAEPDLKKHALLSSRLTERSVTLVKSTPGLLPVGAGGTSRIVFFGDNHLYASSLLKNVFKPVASADDLNRDEPLIMAIFTNVAAWRGSSGIDGSEKEKVLSLLKRTKNTVVISFGSPYVLRHFKEAGALIAAYEATEQAQTAVIKCLNGEINFTGRLPINAL